MSGTQVVAYVVAPVLGIGLALLAAYLHKRSAPDGERRHTPAE